MSGKARYDNYIPLLSESNDNRVRLFLHELQNAADASRKARNASAYIAADVSINVLSQAFLARYFTNKRGADDTAIHPEWVDFWTHVVSRNDGKTQAVPNGADIVRIIKSLANAQDGSIAQLMQWVVQAVMASVSDATGANIKANPSVWGSAVGYQFKASAQLRNELHNNANVPLSNAVDQDLAIAAAGTPNKDDLLARVSAPRDFGYNVDKYFVQMMLEDSLNAPVAVGHSKFFDEEEEQSKSEVYFRKADGGLYTKVNGNDVRVDSRSDVISKLTIKDKCLGTGFFEGAAPANGESCADYLRSCLSGKDITQCKAYLSSAKYWEKAVDEVNAMLPAMALRTIRAFEFGFENYHDQTADRQLLRVKNTTQWLASLAEMVTPPAGVVAKLSKGEYDQIANNKKLIGYLDMLVKKINSNPAILNKDYVGESDAARVNDPSAFVGTKLAKMGVRPRLAVDTLSPSSVERLGQGMRASQDRIAVTLRLPGQVGAPYSFLMSGGGNPIEDLEEFLTKESKQTWAILQRHYLGLVNRLNGHKKSLSSEDDAKIRDLINDLKKSELKLTKIILFTEKYAKLLEVHRQHDPSNVLTVDHLKDFVEQRNKYFARVAKKQNDLISIIKSIAEAVNKEAPAPEVSSKDVDASQVNFANLLG